MTFQAGNEEGGYSVLKKGKGEKKRIKIRFTIKSLHSPSPISSLPLSHSFLFSFSTLPPHKTTQIPNFNLHALGDSTPVLLPIIVRRLHHGHSERQQRGEFLPKEKGKGGKERIHKNSNRNTCNKTRKKTTQNKQTFVFLSIFGLEFKRFLTSSVLPPRQASYNFSSRFVNQSKKNGIGKETKRKKKEKHKKKKIITRKMIGPRNDRIKTPKNIHKKKTSQDIPKLSQNCGNPFFLLFFVLLFFFFVVGCLFVSSDCFSKSFDDRKQSGKQPTARTFFFFFFFSSVSFLSFLFLSFPFLFFSFLFFSFLVFLFVFLEKKLLFAPLPHSPTNLGTGIFERKERALKTLLIKTTNKIDIKLIF